MIIYKCTSPSGKNYIGQTINSLARRRAQHAKSKLDLPITRAIKKHGDKLRWSIIDRAQTHAELNQKESHWIKKLNALHPHGYNLRDGGAGGGRPSELTIAKIAASQTGKTHTAASRALMSANRKGKPAHNKGKRMSAESCARMRGKRKPQTAAAKLKISQSQTARHAARKSIAAHC